jgi:excisionase family DNA binding protein
LGISEVTARRWVKSGKLKAYQPGRRYLIPRSAVEALLRPAEGPPSLQASNERFAEMIAEADDGELAAMKAELKEHLPEGGPLPVPKPTPKGLLALDRCVAIYREQKRRLEDEGEHLQELMAAVTA